MEIKFRGKPDYNKDEFVIGDLKRVSDNRRGGEFHYIYVATDDIEEEGEEVLVDARSVGQYINLKDEHEEEIYVGDFLFYGPILGEVLYHDGSFILRPHKNSNNLMDVKLNGKVTNMCTIAGSIHDEYQP